MGGGTYILGCGGVVAVVAALAHGAGAVRRTALPGWTGARAVLAQIVIAVGLGLTVARLAGAVGLFTGPVVLLAEVGAGLLAGVVARGWARRAHRSGDLRRWTSGGGPGRGRVPVVGDGAPERRSGGGWRIRGEQHVIRILVAAAFYEVSST